MIVRITDTTDRQYLGHEFESTDNPIVLSDDVKVYVERTIPLPNGLRFVSSNYIIDTQES